MKPHRAKSYQVTPDQPEAAHSRDEDQLPEKSREQQQPHIQASDSGRQKVMPRRMLHLIRRMLIFVTAMIYLNICIRACVDSVHVLRGNENPPMDFVPYETTLMAKYVGTTTLRQSPLVKNVLQDDISLRTSGTLFLEDETATSFTTCTRVAALPERVYTDAFQRAAYKQVAHDTAYNITLFDPKVTELIMPVVDCTSSSITYEDITAVRFFYLLRMVADPEDVYLLTVSLSVQEYKIRERNEFGSAGVASLAFINDLRATQVTHYFMVALGYPFLQATFEVYEIEQVTIESFWLLKCIQSDPSKTVKLVQTAARTGFYISTENEQSNIKNTLWELSQSPLHTITYWQWMGRPVLRDSWAWIHLMHFLVSIDVLVNLVVLLTVIYHNLKVGTVWIGDAFIAVSTTLYVRSSLVIVSWYLNEFWAVIEFSMFTGNVISGTQSLYIYPTIMRADLLAIYFCLISFIGFVLKERIDPALAIGAFYLGFEKRIDITKFFPAFVDTLTKHVKKDYNLGMNDVDPEFVDISPLRLWSTHPLVDKSVVFIAASLVPIFSTSLLIIVYVALRKLYRRVYPDKLVVQRMTGFSEDEGQLLQLKGSLTLFEVATGAALQSRYGVIAGYNNCVYIKGVKYATADGIYSSGYVIASGKFLVQTNDLLSIWIMKLIQKRFRNIYVYDVEGTTVKQQARLVYPDTMSFQDLLNLNINILS